MTEKRFTLNSVLNFDFGICDYGEPIGSLRNICELLNELHEENTMLKERRHEDINELSVIAMKYKALENENEQLKHSIKCLEADKMELQQYIKRMQGDVE